MANTPESTLYVYYNLADMMLACVNYHQDTKILSGPNSQGSYFAYKLTNESSTDKVHDLFVYQENGRWRKKFS